MAVTFYHPDAWGAANTKSKGIQLSCEISVILFRLVCYLPDTKWMTNLLSVDQERKSLMIKENICMSGIKIFRSSPSTVAREGQ